MHSNRTTRGADSTAPVPAQLAVPDEAELDVAGEELYRRVEVVVDLADLVQRIVEVYDESGTTPPDEITKEQIANVYTFAIDVKADLETLEVALAEAAGRAPGSQPDAP